MADLLPSLSSEDERPNARDDSDDEEDNDEVDNSFQFGGILVSLLRRCRDENLAVIACRLPQLPSFHHSSHRSLNDYYFLSNF